MKFRSNCEFTKHNLFQPSPHIHPPQSSESHLTLYTHARYSHLSNGTERFTVRSCHSFDGRIASKRPRIYAFHSRLRIEKKKSRRIVSFIISKHTSIRIHRVYNRDLCMFVEIKTKKTCIGRVSLYIKQSSVQQKRDLFQSRHSSVV